MLKNNTWFMKIIKSSEFLTVLILLSLSIFTWRHIPALPFQGEGFYYFKKLSSNFSIQFPLPQDAFALVIFNFIAPIFKEQVNLYMYLLFIVMLVIDIAMYIFIRVITGNRLAAFSTAFLFSISYVGNYDMYSIGGYQYFVQRAVVLLPQLIALTFLILYFLRNFQIKYYVISLALFLLAIAMGFFGTWFLPPFIFYPCFYLLFNLKKIKQIWFKAIWVPFPFLIGNILLIKHGLSPYTEESFLSFVFHNSKVVPGLIQQLVVISLPPGTYDLSIKFLHLTEKTQVTPILGILTLILYISASIFIWKFKPSWRILVATSIASIVLMLLFNLYLNSANVLFTLGSSRYFYFPFVFVAVFWGLFLTAFSFSLKEKRNYVLLIFCVVWLVVNNRAIQKNLKADEWMNTANKDTIDYLRLWSEDLKRDPSYVYLPANLGSYGAGFAFRYFSHPDGKFRLQGFEDLDLPALAREKVDPEKLYVLYRDQAQEIVIDKTEESRALLRQLEKKK